MYFFITTDVKSYYSCFVHEMVNTIQYNPNHLVVYCFVCGFLHTNKIFDWKYSPMSLNLWKIMMELNKTEPEAIGVMIQNTI